MYFPVVLIEYGCGPLSFSWSKVEVLIGFNYWSLFRI
jgi:hypothetical protein